MGQKIMSCPTDGNNTTQPTLILGDPLGLDLEWHAQNLAQHKRPRQGYDSTAEVQPTDGNSALREEIVRLEAELAAAKLKIAMLEAAAEVTLTPRQVAGIWAFWCGIFTALMHGEISVPELLTCKRNSGDLEAVSATENHEKAIEIYNNASTNQTFAALVQEDAAVLRRHKQLLFHHDQGSAACSEVMRLSEVHLDELLRTE